MTRSNRARRWAARTALCALALAAVPLALAAAAATAGSATGTVLVQQRGADGAVALGGCYALTRPDDPDFQARFCDGYDQAGTNDGLVTLAELAPGLYRVEETTAPRSYKLAAGSFDVTVVAGATVTVTRTHERLPVVRVVTKDAEGGLVPGSCWRVSIAGVPESSVEDACDADSGGADGTTELTTLLPDSYELRQLQAPDGFELLEAATPFEMTDDPQTITITLTRSVAPANVAAPVVSGTAAVGATLTGERGTWTGTSLQFAYSWERCDLAGAQCLPIAGADAAQRVVALEDAGATLRFAVTASNAVGSATARSAAVAVEQLAAPRNTAAPTIAGDVAVGRPLVGDPGSWTGAATLAYQWQRCDAAGASCVDIAAATSPRYTPSRDEAGSRFRLAVTGTNPAGSSTALSQPTARLETAPVNVEQPTIRGNPEVGQQLEGFPGRWLSTYGNVQFTYSWLRCNAAGQDCAAIVVNGGDFYTVRRDDEGFRFRIEVTATDAGGTSAPVRSNPTLVVPPTRPVNVVPPSIVGEPVVGNRLRADVGRWESRYGDVRFEYRWSRCEPGKTGCDYQSSGSSYKLGRDDAGYELLLKVIAWNDRGDSYAAAYSEVVRAYPPVNVVPPAIVGELVVGQRLYAGPGLWHSDYGRVRLEYRWSRCEPGKTGCDYQSSAGSYKLGGDDVGHFLLLKVIASNDHGENYAATYSGVVRSFPPVNVEPPSIVGEPVVGTRLRANVGRWQSDYGDVRFEYRWSRCTSGQVGCDYQSSGSSYTLGRDDAGHYLLLKVIAWNDQGDSYAAAYSELVRAYPPVNVEPPSIVGEAVVGNRLRADVGRWESSYGDVRFEYRWSRCQPEHAGCEYQSSGRTYSLGRDDIGHLLLLKVIAWNEHGDSYAATYSEIVRRA